MPRSIRSETEPGGIWEDLLTFYTKFFDCTSKVGLFPYQFNANTLELVPIESGFSYYLFIFNCIFFFTQTSKVCILLLLNYWTNFEFQEMEDGYILQLNWIIGCLMVFAMTYCYSWDRKSFASALTSHIRFEKDFSQGKIWIL